MPFPRKSFKDTQALFKAKSSTASLDAHVSNVENEKTQSTAPPAPPKLHKDARAYDHERQRLKKAADFVKMRARKAQQGAGGPGGKAHHRTGSGKDSMEGAQLSEKGARLQEQEDIEYDEVGEGLVLSNSRKENVGIVTAMTDQARYEVKLADLIRPGKQRKPKGDGDFEVVPHIRSVIALDDNTPDELDIDEPWEHIYSTDCEENKGLSYAQVAALSK